MRRMNVKVICVLHAHMSILCAYVVWGRIPLSILIYVSTVSALCMCTCVCENTLGLAGPLDRVMGTTSFVWKPTGFSFLCEADVEWLFPVSWDHSSLSLPPFNTDEFTHSHIFIMCIHQKKKKKEAYYSNMLFEYGILMSLLFRWW